MGFFSSLLANYLLVLVAFSVWKNWARTKDTWKCFASSLTVASSASPMQALDHFVLCVAAVNNQHASSGVEEAAKREGESMKQKLVQVFPAEEVFVERLTQSFAETNILWFIGPKGLGKRKAAKILAQEALQTSDINKNSCFVQSNLTSPDASLSLNFENDCEKRVLVLSEGFSNLRKLEEVMKQVKASQDVIAIFVDDVPPEFGLDAQFSLDEAQEYIRSKLYERNVSSSHAGDVLSVIPFLPKTTRVLEAHLSRECQKFDGQEPRLVCDSLAIAQAAVKLEGSCFQPNQTHNQTVTYFQEALSKQYEITLQQIAENCEDTGEIRAVSLQVYPALEGNCSTDGILKWIRFQELRSF